MIGLPQASQFRRTRRRLVQHPARAERGGGAGRIRGDGLVWREVSPRQRGRAPGRIASASWYRTGMDADTNGQCSSPCSRGASGSGWSCAHRRRMPSRSTSSPSSGCGRCSIPAASARSTSCTCRSGRPVRLMMTSQDVIHSFYVPAFRIKQDVLPGRYTTLWFTATKTGDYPPVLRRILRHRAFAHGRQRGGAWSRAISSDGCRRGSAGTDAARRRARAVPPLRLQRLPRSRNRRCARRICEGCTAARCRLPDGSTRRSPTSATSATRSCCPASKIVAGYEPIMPTLPGPARRRATCSADRLPQVAAAAAPGDRRMNRVEHTAIAERQLSQRGLQPCARGC